MSGGEIRALETGVGSPQEPRYHPRGQGSSAHLPPERGDRKTPWCTSPSLERRPHTPLVCCRQARRVSAPEGGCFPALGFTRPGVPPLQLRLQAFKSDSCSVHLRLCSWLLDVARAGPWEAGGSERAAGDRRRSPSPGKDLPAALEAGAYA